MLTSISVSTSHEESIAVVLRVAVVGSGPAGSSAAEVLAKAGIETIYLNAN